MRARATLEKGDENLCVCVCASITLVADKGNNAIEQIVCDTIKRGKQFCDYSQRLLSLSVSASVCHKAML